MPDCPHSVFLAELRTISHDVEQVQDCTLANHLVLHGPIAIRDVAESGGSLLLNSNTRELACRRLAECTTRIDALAAVWVSTADAHNKGHHGPYLLCHPWDATGLEHLDELSHAAQRRNLGSTPGSGLLDHLVRHLFRLSASISSTLLVVASQAAQSTSSHLWQPCDGAAHTHDQRPDAADLGDLVAVLWHRADLD